MKFKKLFSRPNNFFLCSIFALALSSLSHSAFATDAYSQTTQGGAYPSYPTINYGTGANAEQLKRGEYLTKLGDCIACHTTQNGKPFAGGYPIDTPFGTIYTPNLTADKETGIGSWSEKDFIRAMRDGISPHGQYYYPAFPYLFFNIVSDEDLLAIRAYLQAVPAVHQMNKKNSMMFPFNWRFLQLGWRIMFFDMQKTGPFTPNPKQSVAWNRGNYLVNGLGHCGMCHTPSYFLLSEKYSLAAPIRKYDFTGNMVQGFYAPNITSTLLRNVTTDEFSRVFLQDRLIGGGSVEGPMKDANHDSLKYLTMDDIKAIDTYLVSVVSQTPPKRTSSTSGSTQGQDIYEKYCTGCHTTGAGGAPKIGDATAWAPRIKQGLNVMYKNAINGIRGMPPKGTCISCTNQEIQDAVNYIVDQSGSSAGTETTTTAKAIPKLTMADGKRIYEKYCAICHAPGTHYLNAPKVGDQQTWAPLIKEGVDIAILRTIQGYGNMSPRGGCSQCNDAEIKAAVLYMIQNSQTGKDYNLW
jgi:cytochrome c5